jgi:hypothetical protein
MADKTDVLLQLYTEERAQARQSEDQRATLTNIIIVIVGAGLAFISDQKLADEALALSVPMMVIGVFGAVVSAKYFERWYRHWTRAYAYRAQLFDLYPDIDVQLGSYSHEPTRKRTDVYEREADDRFKRSSKWRLYSLWIGFHCAIIVGGGLLTVLILVEN